MDLTNDQIKVEFERQVNLCSGIGKTEMINIVNSQFTSSSTQKIIDNGNTSELEKARAKAKKCDELSEQIGKFYEDENSEGDLTVIGEICASKLGYL